jgi:hypothetical protein
VASLSRLVPEAARPATLAAAVSPPATDLRVPALSQQLQRPSQQRLIRQRYKSSDI